MLDMNAASGVRVSLAKAIRDARNTRRLKPLGRVRIKNFTAKFCVTAWWLLDILGVGKRKKLNIGFHHIKILEVAVKARPNPYRICDADDYSIANR